MSRDQKKHWENKRAVEPLREFLASVYLPPQVHLPEATLKISNKQPKLVENTRTGHKFHN